MKIDTRQEDMVFRAKLLRDIPYFHKIYAKYKTPISLEIATNLGKMVEGLNRRIQAQNLVSTPHNSLSPPTP